MIELTEGDFEALSRAEPVRAAFAAMEEQRRRRLRNFWLLLVGGTLLTVAYMWPLIASGHDIPALLGPIFWLVTTILALAQIGRWSADIKLPVLAALADIAGMQYEAVRFEPPVFPAARTALFGGGIVGQAFTDLFRSKEGEGPRFAVYEAMLNRPSGRSAQTVFSGQVYVFGRRGAGYGEVVIVPDRGLFRFLNPSGFVRVEFDADEAFERQFDVYSSDAAQALGLLGDEARRELLELRRLGRVFAWIGPSDVLVAVAAKNRFEPGNMFRATPAEERLRHMFDDVRGSLAILTRLDRVLG